MLVSLFLFGATFAAEQKRSLSDRYCFCYNQQLNIFDEAVLKRAFPDLQKNGDEQELLAENFFQEKCSFLSELAALEEKQKSNEKACFLIFKIILKKAQPLKPLL